MKDIIKTRRSISSSFLFPVQNYLFLLFNKCRVYIQYARLVSRIFTCELDVIGRDRCFCFARFEGERDVASSV